MPAPYNVIIIIICNICMLYIFYTARAGMSLRTTTCSSVGKRTPEGWKIHLCTRTSRGTTMLCSTSSTTLDRPTACVATAGSLAATHSHPLGTGERGPLQVSRMTAM